MQLLPERNSNIEIGSNGTQSAGTLATMLRFPIIGGRPLSSLITAPTKHITPYESAPARQAMTARTKRRRLATTPRGHLAPVPASTQPGDAMLVLLGHGNPVIASAMIMGSGKTLCKIKGVAYVCMIMDGKAFRRNIVESGKDWFEEFPFLKKSSIPCTEGVHLLLNDAL